MTEADLTPLTVDAATIVAFVGYLAVVLGIGVFAARYSSAGLGEFFVGGRRMHRFVVALSAVVSGRSAWLLLGLTGMAYTIGVSAIWSAVGYIVVELLLFLYYAPRLRRFAERHDTVTLPDFYAARFADKSGALRILLALVILTFMVAYVSAQFVAGGKAIGASFGLQPETGIMLTALIVLGYTVLGGFVAVSLTDTLQGILMLFALVALPAIAIGSAGGGAAVISELRAFDPTMLDPLAIGVGAFIGAVGIGLGSPGNPHILVRYISIRSAAQLRYAAVVGTSWNVVMAVGAVVIGVVGRVHFPDAALLGGDTENLYPLLARQQLPPAFFGLVVAAVFAAIMSTADSQLLVAASSVVRDVYEKVARRGRPVSRRLLVLYSRILVIVLVAAALALGRIAEELVFWLVLFAWAGLGAAIGPTSLLALFWRRTTRAGVAAGIVAGALTTIIWRLVPELRSIVYELIPGFVAGLLVTVLVSLLTRPPPDVEALFDAMEQQRDSSP